MTHAERAAVERATDRPLVFRAMADPRFVELLAGPCPLLDDHEDGTASCSVWSVRPFNCRRFNCYRSPGEPWESRPDGSCANLDDRLEASREVRRDYALKQRKAARWALSHGWPQ